MDRSNQGNRNPVHPFTHTIVIWLYSYFIYLIDFIYIGEDLRLQPGIYGVLRWKSSKGFKSKH